MSLSVSKFSISTVSHQLIDTDPQMLISQTKSELTTSKATKYYASIGSLLVLAATLTVTHVFMKKYFFHVLTISSLALYYFTQAVHKEMNSKISTYKSKLKYYKQILESYKIFLSMKEEGELKQYLKTDLILKKYMKRDPNHGNYGINIEEKDSILLPLLAQYDFLIPKVRDLIVNYKYSKTRICFTKDYNETKRVHYEIMEREEELLFYTLFISFLVSMIRNPKYARLIKFDQLIDIHSISSEMRTILKYHDVSLEEFFATFKFTPDRFYNSRVTTILPRPIIPKEIKGIRDALRKDFTQLSKELNKPESTTIDPQSSSTTISPIIGKDTSTPQLEKDVSHDEWIASSLEKHNLDSAEIPAGYFKCIQELQDLFEKNMVKFIEKQFEIPVSNSIAQSKTPGQSQSNVVN